MKKTIAVLGIAGLLVLSGCSGPLSRDDVDGMIKLKTKCEGAGGIFTTWNTDFNGWNYKCDLSTNPEEQ